MDSTNITTAHALRNSLLDRRERERRTLIDMGYSPDLAAAIMDTDAIRHALMTRREYLAKRAIYGAHKRGLKKSEPARLSPAPIPNPASVARPTFDDIFGDAA